MRKLLFVLSMSILMTNCSDQQKGQSTKVKTNDETHEINKDDRLNLFNSEEINKIDLLEALDFSGLQIHKFDIGEFKRRQDIIILMEEFENGNLKATDTLAFTDNLFYEGFDESGSPKIGFIDQIKIFTKTSNEKSELLVKTYKGQIAKRNVQLNKVDRIQFFLWRDYINTKWQINSKVPLMIFASSWFDKNINNHRFCGVAKLTEDTEATNELLQNSPNYLLISYKVID